MTYQKLINCLYKEIGEIKNYKPDKISRPYFSFRAIRNNFFNYTNVDISIKHYCCCGDEKCCWVDIESNDYGWIWKDNNPADMPRILYNYLRDICRVYNKALHKRRIFEFDDESAHRIIIPFRDLAHFDIWISFWNE